MVTIEVLLRAARVPEEDVPRYAAAFEAESIDLETLVGAYTRRYGGNPRSVVDFYLRDLLPVAGFRARFITELGRHTRGERVGVTPALTVWALCRLQGRRFA